MDSGHSEHEHTTSVSFVPDDLLLGRRLALVFEIGILFIVSTSESGPVSYNKIFV